MATTGRSLPPRQAWILRTARRMTAGVRRSPRAMTLASTRSGSATKALSSCAQGDGPGRDARRLAMTLASIRSDRGTKAPVSLRAG